MAASSGEKKAPAARICRWYGGKKAALSLRFDDSHATHIQNALPLLNEYGCIGTFLVNPGNPGYQENRSVWEGALLAAGHELGDHTFNHNGARTDRDAEAQIGKAAEAIRQADPARTQTIVFLGGGGTQWMQRKPFDFFLAKYHLLRLTLGWGSMSCREDTPWKPSDFAAGLDRAIGEGRWMQAHFHCVGAGHLPISVESFRTVLDTARAHRDELWQSGLNSIARYESERDHSIVWAYAKSDDEVGLDLVCEVEAELFCQPLTLELDLPARATKVVVTDAAGDVVPSRVEKAETGKVVRFEAAPVDASFVVTAPGLGASYRRKHGPDLKGGAHPYLFFTKADLPALRAKMEQPFARDIWQRLKASADGLVSGDPAEWKIDGTHWHIRNLAFVYALTGERKYADRGWRELEVLLRSDQWHMPPSEALVTSEATGTMWMAYDWMYSALTEEQRRQVREVMIEHALLPTMRAVERKEWYTHWSRGNWGGVIYGQIGVAALSLLDDDPRAAEWARECRRLVWHYTQSVGGEGGWGESGSYAEYLWPRVLMLSVALRRASRGQTDFFDTANLPHLAEWFLQLLEPDEQRYVPFSNCALGTGDGQILLRLAAEYRDGHAQWFGRRMAERKGASSPFAFLWADPTLEAKPPADLPTAKVFRDIDWAFLRSRWEDPQATLFGLKGGQKDWDHAHHDTNSFVLYAHGQPLIVDLRYPHEIWGCETEAHNTIMVNGKEQAGPVHVAGGRENPMHRGVISDLLETPWYTRLVGDASLAYEPADVNSFVREVMYLRDTGPGGREYFVLFDDVDATAPSRYDWRLHTYGAAARTGNRVTITQGPAAVDVMMASPADLSCEFSEKVLKEIKCDSPLEGVETLQQVTLTPTQPSARGNFVSVLVPRLASASPEEVKVAPVEAENLRGAEITFGDTRDLALFALEAPQISAAGVEATGRTCFVRQSGGRVTNAVLHGGERLVVNGVTLFETVSSGSIALTFSDTGVRAVTRLYDAYHVKVHVDRPPTTVLADGREAEFSYDPESRLVDIAKFGLREIEIRY